MIDNGPWRVSQTGMSVYSDDFTHDVVLKISGDFGDKKQRMEYAEWLAKTLNAAPRLCSVCEDEFVAEKPYYHRCSTCQRDTYLEEDHFEEEEDYSFVKSKAWNGPSEDYTEADYEISGFDLSVDWHK